MRIVRALAVTSVAFLAVACGHQQDVLVHSLFPAETVGARSGSFEQGYRYANGIGTTKDYAAARQAYAAAAAAGDARAMNNLGVMTLHGRGGPVEAASAIRHFRSAASAGSHTGRYNLGLAYETGTFVKHDPAAAAHEYRIAAEMGHAGAQARLAAMLEGGHGVAAQPAEAARLYRLAAAGGDASAIAGLERLEGNRLPPAGKPASVHFAEESCDCLLSSERKMASRGLQALEKAANDGDAAAMYNLGVRLLNGQAATHDPSRAARLFTLSSRKGYIPAQRQLAQMHLRGQAVVPSKVIAHAWLNMASTGTGADAVAARDEMESLELSMTTKDIAEAQVLAASWRKMDR